MGYPGKTMSDLASRASVAENCLNGGYDKYLNIAKNFPYRMHGFVESIPVNLKIIFMRETSFGCEQYVISLSNKKRMLIG